MFVLALYRQTCVFLGIWERTIVSYNSWCFGSDIYINTYIMRICTGIINSIKAKAAHNKIFAAVVLTYQKIVGLVFVNCF